VGWNVGVGAFAMKRKKRFKERRLQRGIYVLPNLLTSANLFCGFYAIIAAIQGQFIKGAIAIMVAAVFDALDGKIARVTRTVSKFGVEYDSLSDAISFGVAPGILVYLWALQPFGRLGCHRLADPGGRLYDRCNGLASPSSRRGWDHETRDHPHYDLCVVILDGQHGQILQLQAYNAFQEDEIQHASGRYPLCHRDCGRTKPYLLPFDVLLRPFGPLYNPVVT